MLTKKYQSADYSSVWLWSDSVEWYENVSYAKALEREKKNVKHKSGASWLCGDRNNSERKPY